MKTACRLAVCALVVLAWSIALAEVTVKNYSWLQLPPSAVTASCGNPAGTGGSDHGHPDMFRWGERVWIPNGTLTADGTGDYWATLTFDKPRSVKLVKTQFWADESTQLQAFLIEGTTDGKTWTKIGSYDSGEMKTGDPLTPPDVTVTDGDYLAIRVRMSKGGYMYDRPERGGPGLYTIEPYGDGTLTDSEVNWANKENFATVASVSGMNQDSNTRFNDGALWEAARTGCKPGAWPADAYAQIDLGKSRTIGKVIVAWHMGYAQGIEATLFKVKYSTDGVTFNDVTGLSAPVRLAGPSAMQYTFDPVAAQYVRITDMVGTNYTLFTQVLVYGPDKQGGIPPAAAGP